MVINEWALDAIIESAKNSLAFCDTEQSYRDMLGDGNEKWDSRDIAFQRLGFLEGSLKHTVSVLESLKSRDKDVIGETVVRWHRCDIENEFEDRYGRQPTEEEVNDILEYLSDLDETGADSANELGLDKIYNAFEDWENESGIRNELDADGYSVEGEEFYADLGDE